MLGVTALFVLAVGQGSASTTGPQFVPGELLVKYRAGATPTATNRTFAKVGGKLKERILTRAMRQHGDREVLVVTTAKNDEESKRLLQLLGMPFAG